MATETVIEGTVQKEGAPVEGAFVRLLDKTGEFTAEVKTDDQGGFRFFAAPGDWTLRALATGGAKADQQVTAEAGAQTKVAISI
jgi:uncharacterized GH25 family protein